MSIYVRNGTPQSGQSLCETCVNAHIENGHRENEQLVICEQTYPDHRVLFRVRQCSGYTEQKRQTLKQMEDIAWVVTANGGKRTTGFRQPGSDENEIELIIQAPNGC